MCGIFGIITRRGDIPAVPLTQKSLDLLAHRGPDAEGLFHRDSVTLGHRRLSIIDLAAGSQPMESADGRACLTYNGEIYNFRELRRELEEHGHVFRTNSDTELLLAAYCRWGTDCLSRLHGMFAFAIADFERREVFLARDIFGIKPLLYRTDGLFAFSSELPPLAALACLPQPGVDASALAQFFRYQYIAAPRTIYKDIRKLPPAHCMLVDFSGGIKKIWQYHAFHFAPAAIGHDEALAATERVIQSTVAVSTVADVPIGVYLSGGIDSTLMALCLTRVVGRSIPAFTIAFREEGFSELPFAQRAAQHLGLNLHEEYVESMALDKLPDILAPYGEPFGDSSVLPTWHLAQLTRRHVKVVFSGDGGDELFGGYSSYAHWLTELRRRNLSGAMRAAMTFRPKEALRCLRSVWRRSKRDVDTWHRFMECNTPKAVARLLTPDFRSHAGDMADVFSSVKGHERDFASDLDMAQYLDIRTYLPEDILYKVDVTSMQHSLEARPAFLSPDVLAHACRLPEECRRQEAGGGKVMLKELLLEAGFPPSFVHRRKQGFAIPVNAWFTRKGAARALLMDMLATHGREMAAYIDLRNVQELLARHDASPRNGEQCWLVLAFALWLESRKKPAAAPA